MFDLTSDSVNKSVSHVIASLGSAREVGESLVVPVRGGRVVGRLVRAMEELGEQLKDSANNLKEPH